MDEIESTAKALHGALTKYASLEPRGTARATVGAKPIWRSRVATSAADARRVGAQREAVGAEEITGVTMSATNIRGCPVLRLRVAYVGLARQTSGRP